MNTIVSSIVRNDRSGSAASATILIETIDSQGTVQGHSRTFPRGEIAVRMMTLLSGSEIEAAELDAWQIAGSTGDFDLADEASFTAAQRDRAEMLEENVEIDPELELDAIENELPTRGRR